MIKLESITRYFDTGSEIVPVLRNIDLRIDAGESIAIVGESGSGKSTLMNVLGLLDRPSSGRYTIDGRAVDDLEEDERTQLRSRMFGFVFQAFHLIEQRSVRANVEVGLIHSHVPRRDRRDAVDAALARVGLEHRADFNAATLSGGEKQRVAVARAVAGNKQVLLCDEPTGNLDTATSRSVVDLLVELNRSGLTLVVVTHDPLVAQRCSRVVSMRDGIVVPHQPDPPGRIC